MHHRLFVDCPKHRADVSARPESVDVHSEWMEPSERSHRPIDRPPNDCIRVISTDSGISRRETKGAYRNWTIREHSRVY